MLRNTLIQLGESDAARTLVTHSPLCALSRRFVPGDRTKDLIRALAEARGGGG